MTKPKKCHPLSVSRNIDELLSNKLNKGRRFIFLKTAITSNDETNYLVHLQGDPHDYCMEKLLPFLIRYYYCFYVKNTCLKFTKETAKHAPYHPCETFVDFKHIFTNSKTLPALEIQTGKT